MSSKVIIDYLKVVVGLLFLLTLAACGGGGEPVDVATPTQAALDAPPTLSSNAESITGSVRTLADVKTAAIQIQAEGTFLDPAVGLVVSGAGRGSGFIIDPSSLAITNNHVVTGAGLLQVWVGGESQPRNARILGVSECSDLALIDRPTDFLILVQV